MNGKHLDKIGQRLNRVNGWMAASGFLRAASVPSTPGGLRQSRARDLERLVTVDLPALLETVREHNRRGRGTRCVYCGSLLRIHHGYRAGVYSTEVRDDGVICEDPNCAQSPDGHHKEEGD